MLYDDAFFFAKRGIKYTRNRMSNDKKLYIKKQLSEVLCLTDQEEFYQQQGELE